MTVSLWRIGTTRERYVADDLSGAGAAKVGGRFNSPGIPMVYAATSVGLCVLETLVHIGLEAKAQNNRYLVEILIPDEIYANRQTLTVKALHKRTPYWNAAPSVPASAAVGDRWVKTGKSALLCVPSAILPYDGIPDLNVLLNPAHPDAKRIKAGRVTQFIYDARL